MRNHPLLSLNLVLSTLIAAVLFVVFVALPQQRGRAQAQTIPTAAIDSAASSNLIQKAAQKGSLRLLVTLKTNTFQPEGNLPDSARQTQRSAIQTAQNSVLSRLAAGSGKYSLIAAYQRYPLIALKADAAAIQVLQQSPEVVNITEDVPVPPLDSTTNTVVGVSTAWGKGYDGTGWTVVELDTGVQTSHPYLSGKTVAEACFSTTDSAYTATTLCPNGQSTSGTTPGQTGTGSGVNCSTSISGCEHGTAVAGIAVGKNYTGGPGYDGIARGANLISLQVYSEFTSSTYCGATSPCILSFSSDEIAALDYVYSTLYPLYSKIAAVNMSLGSGKYTANCDTDPLKPAIDTLSSVNIATVIAAGNSSYTNALDTPACISTAVSVGATDNSDNIASFSNQASFMSLFAPGNSVGIAMPTSTYGTGSGTSFSAPLVSGAWALLREEHPTYTVAQILSLVQSTGKAITISGGTTVERISLSGVFNVATSTPSNTPSNTPTPSKTSTPTATKTNTATPTASKTPTNTNTPSKTPTATATPTASSTPIASLIVNTTSDVTNGSCSSTCTLRDAMSLIGSGGTITFSVNGTIALTSTLPNVANTMTINGSGHTITIDGGSTYQLISINNTGTLTVNNLTFSNAKGSFDGGAIFNGNVLNVNNSTFTGNSAGAGGGAIASGTTGTVLNVINSTFDNNSATKGGAIYVQNGADDTGNIANSTFVSNSASTGAALFGLNGVLNVTNTTFSANGTAGGDATISLLNGTLVLNNSLLTRSVTADCAFTSTTKSGTHNLSDNSCPGTVAAPTSVSSTLANNGGLTQTLALLTGSNAIDAVANGSCVYSSTGTNSLFTSGAAITTDQRGTSRPQGTLCDIGAYEYSVSVPTATNTGTNTFTPTTTSTATNTATLTSTPSSTTSPTLTATASNTPSSTATNTATNTATLTSTPSSTTSPTLTATASNTPSNTATNTSTSTVTLSNTPSSTTAPTLTATASSTPSSTATSTATNTVTLSNTPSSTATGTATSTATQTNPPTNTATFTATVTASNTVTKTATPTSTLTSTAVPARIDSIGIFRAGTFYLRLHNSTGNADLTVTFTAGTSPYPVVGDWTGSGFDTVGVFDQSNGQFTLCTANVTATCASVANQKSLVLGVPNDVPLSGRWLINATNAGVGVFRPSNGLIYLKNALNTGYADYTMVLGIPGDTGLAGDWNGKGFDSPGVYRPGNSSFYLSNQVINGSVYGDYQFAYGIGGDAPVVGDWIAQGHDGVGLFRQSNGFTYLKNQLVTGYADYTFTYGIAGDVPVAGHWQAVYPPAAPPAPILIAKTAAPRSNIQGGSVPGGDQIGG